MQTFDELPPDTVLYVPGTQGIQADCSVDPCVSVYVPREQAVQDDWPFHGWYVPNGHFVQEDDPLKLKDPEGQTSQLEDIDSELDVPAGQV